MKYIHWIIYVVLTAAIAYLFYTTSFHHRVAIVQSQLIIEQYEGMIEAKKKYKNEVAALNKKFEIQKKLFEIKKRVYDSLQSTYTSEKRMVNLRALEQQRQKTFQLGEAIKKKADFQEDKLLQGIFNKINVE